MVVVSGGSWNWRGTNGFSDGREPCRVSKEPWSWVEAVCGGYIREHVDDDE